MGSLESLYNIMGKFGNEANALVKSQLEYNSATKELDRIKKQASGIDDALRKRIETISARSDLTLDQKTAIIRNARFRASARKDDLERMNKMPQRKSNTLKDELKRKEQILNTLLA